MCRKQLLTLTVASLVMLVLVPFLSACAPQTGAVATDAPPPAEEEASVVEATPTDEPAAAAAPERPFAGVTEWIAFQRGDTSERIGVWLVHPDGSDEHQVFTDLQAEVRYPAWSPDGTRVVAVTAGGGSSDKLYEYDLETGTSRELFPCLSDEPCNYFFDEPSYSPDGKKVSFVRYHGDFTFNEDFGDMSPTLCGLWIGEIASGELTEITRNEACDREYYPLWSPDGTQFVYTYAPYADGQLLRTSVYVMGADGSGKRQLTDDALNAGEPSWSPDGEWVVFSTYPLGEFDSPPEPSNLYRVHIDGSGLEQLTFNENPSLRAVLPRYSADGEWILFTMVAPSDRSLWVVPAEGGEPIVIAQGSGLGSNYTFGVWQPSEN